MKLSLKYPRVVFEIGPRLLYEYAFMAKDAKDTSKRSLLKRYNRLRYLVLRLNNDFRIDSYVEGYSKIRSLQEEGVTFLLVSNHMSDYDPLYSLSFLTRPISFVAKEETKKFPFIGKAIASVDGLFLPRSDLRTSLGIMKTLEERLRCGFSNYLIYPEGTRNKDPEHTDSLPFHPGSFKSAMRANVVIVPMALYGTFRVLKAAPNDKRIPIEAAFLDPIFRKDYEGKTTEEIASFIQKEIDAKVQQFKKMDQDFYQKGFQKIPLKRGKLR